MHADIEELFLTTNSVSNPLLVDLLQAFILCHWNSQLKLMELFIFGLHIRWPLYGFGDSIYKSSHIINTTKDTNLEGPQTNMNTEAEKIAIETENLRKLERFLSSYETASFLVDCVGPSALATAVKMVKANDDDAIPDPATIRGAMKIANEAGEPWRAKPIKLGANRSKVRFNGVSAKPDAPTKTFNSIVNKSTSDFNKLTAEDELPWASSSNNSRITSSKLRVIKDAVLKSRAAQPQNRSVSEAFTVNDTALSILRARALKEGNNTPAARTIVPHPLTSGKSVRTQLPPEFSDSGLVPAQRERSVASMLPAEWKDAKKATVSQEYMDAARAIKAGHVKSLTDAAATIKRPANPDFSNPETNDQGAIADKYWPHPKAATTTD